MKYTVKTGNAAALPTHCLVVPRGSAQTIGEALGVGDLVELTLAGTKDETGKVAQVFRDGRPSRLLIVGKEHGEPCDDATFRKDMNAVAGAIAELDVQDATLWLDEFDVAGRSTSWKTRTALLAVSHAAYRFNRHKSKPKAGSPPKLRRVGVLSKDRSAAKRSVRHAEALDAGLEFAKTLGNEPPNVCDPAHLAAEAKRVFEPESSASVQILEESDMAELGMGAFLSVTQGSSAPAKLVVVQYAGGKRGEAPHVLLGKGITFDTGGINLKPTAGIDEMKFDMCGAASVLGTAKAVVDADLPINLVAMVAAAENMPSGRATRPSDIVATMSGQTVEILNTDAEGRLVLCDSLTYAKRFKPKSVVDVATLTGAQVVALGEPASALYANNDELANDLLAAGDAIGDRMWRMPLWDEYQQQLKSSFADMKNIGGRAAGSVTAACFLSRFAGAFPWAHLDVAGTAYKAKKGSTGRPVPALFEYLIGACAEELESRAATVAAASRRRRTSTS